MDPTQMIPKVMANAQAGRSFGQRLGIHPVLAMLFFLVDWLLFSGEIFTAGVGLLVSIPIAIVMGGIGFFVQRKKSGDSRAAAFVKSALLSVATAIPGPMGAFLPMIQGVLSLMFKPEPPCLPKIEATEEPIHHEDVNDK